MKKVKLGEVCEILDSKRIPITASNRKAGVYPYYGANGIQDYVDNYIFDDELVLLAEDGGNFGSKDKPIAYRVSGKCWVNNHAHVLKAKPNINIEYLCYSLMFYDVSSLVNGATRQKLTQADMRKMEIPLPSLEEQKEIADRLDKVSVLIEKRKIQLSKLDQLIKSRFIEMFGDLMNNPKYSGVPLGTICSPLSGGTPTTKISEYYQGDIPWISTPYLGNNHIDGSIAKAYITDNAIKNSATHLIPANTIMFGIRVGVGKSSIIDEPMCANQDIVALMGIDIGKYNLLFIKHTLDSYQSHFDSIKKGATILGITTEDLKKVIIPVVGMELQNQFASFAEHTDRAKLAIQKSIDKLETLKKSLMQQYFG